MNQIDRYDPDAFDFLGPPFAVPAGDDLLLTLPQEDALSAALNALGRGTGLVLIAGDSGSGRTLVADALSGALRARGLVVDQVAQLGGPGGGALLARLAPLLGVAPDRLAPLLPALAATTPGGGQADAYARGAAARGLAAGEERSGGGAGRAGAAGVIDRHRSDMPQIPGVAQLPGVVRVPGQAVARRAGEARPGCALVVVVDDAGTWPEADLLLLASMAGLRLGDAPLLHAVLIGDAALERRFVALREAAAGLADPGEEAAGRDGGVEAVSLRIPPLTLRQSEEYLAHRFAAAGGSLERTMSPEAVGEILLRCGGNPGRIDQLADDCLAITARRRRRYVTSTVVRTARQAPRERRRLSGPLAYALLGAAGGVVAAGAGFTLAMHNWTQPVPGLVGTPGQAPGQGDAALFAGTGRFAAPVPVIRPPDTVAAPRPYTQDYPAQGFAPMAPRAAVPPSPPAPRAGAGLAAVPPVPAPGATTFPAAPAVPLPVLPPSVVLAPVPAAPPLAGVDTPPRLAVPPLPAAAPATIGSAGTLTMPGAAPPVLPPSPVWPAQAGIAAGPDSAPGKGTPPNVRDLPGAEAPPARNTAQAPASTVPEAMGEALLPVPSPEPVRTPLPRAPPQAAGRAAPSGRHDGPVAVHVAKRRDTATTLLHRIWGGDDQTARALFRSLNPGIDPQGPWPAGTVLVVPQRLRNRSGSDAAALPEPPRLPPALRSRPEVVRDNPAGQVQSGTPYFCRSILPQNGAEDAYTRQVCGR